MEPFPQTYLKFSPVAKSFEVLLTARWCAIVAIRFWPGDWKRGDGVRRQCQYQAQQKKSSNKIDPAVSALMAFGTFRAEHEDFAFDMSDNHKQRLATFNGI